MGGRRGGRTEIQNRIIGMSGAYRGATGTHDTNSRGNKFASHNTNYRNIRRALGLSAG